MFIPADTRLNTRHLAETIADRLGAREDIAELSDLEAVRLLQQREGFTPCYGREVALQPGPDGTCLVAECCWRNFCSAYRSHGVPLDTSLFPAPSKSGLAAFTDFIMSRRVRRANTAIEGLSVTVGGSALLEPLSRKLVIGSPRSTLCESVDSANALRPFQIFFDHRDAGSGHYMKYFDLERTLLWTADPSRIFHWYGTARPLIDDCTIDYLPQLTTQTERIGVWKTNKPEFSNFPTPEFQQLDTPHMALPDGEVMVSDPNFVPLLNVNIPFLESASLTDLHRLIHDYPEELSSFRNFMFRSIDKIKDKRLASETFGADVQSLRREIDDQLRKLRSDMRRSQLKHYIDVAGGVAAAFTLAVFCIVQHDSHTLAVIGPGGFLYVLSSKVTEYLSARLTLKDNPAYFLWMIGRSNPL